MLKMTLFILNYEIWVNKSCKTVLHKWIMRLKLLIGEILALPAIQ